MKMSHLVMGNSDAKLYSRRVLAWKSSGTQYANAEYGVEGVMRCVKSASVGMEISFLRRRAMEQFVTNMKTW